MPSWAVLVAGWVTLVCAGAAVVFRERGRGVRTCGSRFLAGALVVLFALPCGMMLVQAFVAPVTAAGARGQLLAWCTAAVFVAVLLVRGRGVPEALGIIAGLTALVILGDQLLGAPLARGNPLSYSVIYATRFYGLGNEGAGILVAVTLIGIGSRLDSGRGTPRDFLLAGVPVLLVAVLPFLGANVGPAAWGTVAFVAAYLYATGRKITWRLVCAAVAAVAALVGLAALLDLASPEVSHLGRLVESLGAGRGGLAAVLASKVGMVVTIIRATPLVFVLPVGMALLIYLVARPGGPLGRVILARRGFGSALVGSLGGALVSLVTEDSGIALAGFILFFAVMALAALALDAMPQAVPDRRLEAS